MPISNQLNTIMLYRTFVALSGSGSLLVSDAHTHASLVDACRLSRARIVVALRTDVSAVEVALAARAEDRAVVVTDSVLSFFLAVFSSILSSVNFAVGSMIVLVT